MSWKTTTCGILAIVIAAAAAAKAMLEGSTADWGAVAMAVTTGIGLFFAKDHKAEAETK